MKKRVLMISLSMAMVLGLAGIVSAATSDNNTLDMQPKTSIAQAYMNNNDVTSTEVEQGETTQADQTVSANTDVYDQMESSNGSMNEQTENMPMNTQMNDQMSDSQHTQAMAGTNNQKNSNASHQQAQKSSVNNMMGSMGSMGR